MKSSHPDQYDIVFKAPPGKAEPAPEVKLMLEIVENGGSPALLKVFGVGGGGSNAVNRMIQAGLRDVEFWVSNTDLQALELSACHNRLPIGRNTTRGLGAGGDPEIGRLSAEEDAHEIEQIIEGADMIFITAGMGGGTGTGAAPVIARIARELGVLTVGIVTKPFSFEGKKKSARAQRGLEALAEQVDTLISIPNDKLMQIVAPGTSFDDALLMADDVLLQATRGISDLIMGHGIINLDFADVRTVMRGRGNALLGSGTATGDRRALEAAEKAVSSPLLEDLAIEGAEAVLVNIQGGPGMGFHEAAQAAQFVSDQVGEEADVFWGAVVDPNMGEEMRVTLVATGFPESKPPEAVTLRTPAHAGDANGRSRAPEARFREADELVLDDVVARADAHHETDRGFDPLDLEEPVIGARQDDLRPAEPENSGVGTRDRGQQRDPDEFRGANAPSRGARTEAPRSDLPEGVRFERERRQVEEARAASLGQRRLQDAGPRAEAPSDRVDGYAEARSEAGDVAPDPRGGDRGDRSDRGDRRGDARGGARGEYAVDPRSVAGTGNRVSDGRADRRPGDGQDRPADDGGRPGADRRGAARPAEGGRLPERERRSPADSIALGASGLESELFLPKDQAGSDPGLRKSRWASADPEWTEGDDLDRPTQKRRPLDVPTYLRRRVD